MLCRSSAHAISGVARSTDGTPCRDASVYVRAATDAGTSLPPDWGWIRTAGGFVQGALSGADGAFRIPRVPAGTYEVQAVFVENAERITRSAIARVTTGGGPLDLMLSP